MDSRLKSKKEESKPKPKENSSSKESKSKSFDDVQHTLSNWRQIKREKDREKARHKLDSVQNTAGFTNSMEATTDFEELIGIKSKSKWNTSRNDPKLSGKKKGEATSKVTHNPATKGKGKAAIDPNMPKRPQSAFLIFMEEFRTQFTKENPNNNTDSAVGKAANEKWKGLPIVKRTPYVAKAVKQKLDYEKSMKAYKRKQELGPESEKSLSEYDKNDNNDNKDDDEFRKGGSSLLVS